MSNHTEGAQLRADWDATCQHAAKLVEVARQRATEARQPEVASYLARQARAVSGLQGEVDGQRRIPGPQSGTGILHDIPPELGEPEYAEAMDALDRVRDLWDAGLGANGWDWSAGYPPDWPSSFGDRLRAGLVYRKK